MAKDHNAKNCHQQLTCRTCAACHPTKLHGYVPKVKTAARAQQTMHVHQEMQLERKM